MGDLGSSGQPGHVGGALSFRLDRRGAAKTVGQYIFEFGDRNVPYEPSLKLRMGEKPTPCQVQVAEFLGGYLEKEHESVTPSSDGNKKHTKRITSAICLPGVPQ